MIIAVEKDRRRTHRVKMRERHRKMKVAIDSHVLEHIKNLPLDGYLYSDWESDGLWYIKAGKPLVRPSCWGMRKTLLFTGRNYDSMRYVDFKGFGKMLAMPVKMVLHRCICHG